MASVAVIISGKPRSFKRCYPSFKENIIDTLRQKSRQYLFSNSLAPTLVVSCLKALEIINNLFILFRIF